MLVRARETSDPRYSMTPRHPAPALPGLLAFTPGVRVVPALATLRRTDDPGVLVIAVRPNGFLELEGRPGATFAPSLFQIVEPA